MKCVCTKCGRQNNVSAADLRRQRGVVVCPQCLSTFKVPVPQGDDADTPPPVPRRRKTAVSSPKTPAAATKTSEKSPARATAPKRAASTPRPRKKPQAAPAAIGGKGMTKWGCLAWSVGVTFGFFFLYCLLGMLTN